MLFSRTLMHWCWLTVSTLILLVSPVSSEIPRKNNDFPHFIMGRPYHGFVPAPKITATEALAIQSATFSQRVDHLTSGDTRQFQQKYYYNTGNYLDGGPIFLILGGESFDLGSWTVGADLPWVTAAAQWNGTIFALEHRYYGESRPFTEQSDANLKYLTSRQAIEDAKTFIIAMKTKYAYNTNPWIIVGGSYGGSLALWFKNMYPNDAAGAIGTSSFITTTFDFHSYTDKIGEALWLDSYRHDYLDNCTVTLTAAFKLMSAMIYNEVGRKKLSDIFSLTQRLDVNATNTYKDMQLFFASILSTFQGIVQYNHVNVEPYASQALNARSACAIIAAGDGDYVTRVATIHKRMTTMYKSGEYTGINSHYNELVAYLKRSDYADLQQAAARNWLWQECSEFGFLVTTDGGETPFGSILPSNFYIDLCTDVFGAGYNVKTIPKIAAATAELYKNAFDKNQSASWTGRYDPWTDVQSDGGQFEIGISDAAHCAILYPIAENETSEMNRSRTYIDDVITAMATGQPIPSAYPFSTSELSLKAESKPEGKKTVKRSVQMKSARRTSSSSAIPHFLMGRPTRGFINSHTDAEVRADPPNFIQANFTQKVSHTHLNVEDTFPQRYWLNTQYYQPGGPLFLFIEGESEAREKWVRDDVQVMRSAKEFNAAIYMLEHRYYGFSWPTDEGLTSLKDNLKAEEALDDIAYFIEEMNKQKKYTNPKWITFGGSYAGVLSAWFRETHPQLTVGAIASSAPIEIKADFYEYLMVVEDSIKTHSQKCFDVISLGFDEMFRKVQLSQGRVDLSGAFSLDPPWTADSQPSEVDIQFFFQQIFGYFEEAVQYNNDNSGVHATQCNIKDFCDLMKDDTKSPMQRVADAYKTLFMQCENVTTFTSTPNKYTDMVAELKNAINGLASRTWLFQVCFEFGYFQSTDIGYNFFGSSRPVNFFINLCTDVFGDLSFSHFVYQNEHQTQQTFHGRDFYNGTNVVFINGKVDPWSALGEYNAHDSVVVFLMNNTAHCADMYPPMDGESPELAVARQLIHDNINSWLIAANQSTTSAPTTTAGSATSRTVSPPVSAGTPFPTLSTQPTQPPQTTQPPLTTPLPLTTLPPQTTPPPRTTKSTASPPVTTGTPGVQSSQSTNSVSDNTQPTKGLRNEPTTKGSSRLEQTYIAVLLMIFTILKSVV